MHASFKVANEEFAITVERFSEVVVHPGKLHKVPLTPDFVDGMFNLRGNPVPVINLVKLLNLNSDDSSGEKLAILEYGKTKLAILVEAIGEIIPERVESSESLKDGIIERVLKLNEGERIIQVLCPEKLINLSGLTYFAAVDKNEKQSVEQPQKYIRFLSGTSAFAIELGSVAEVLLPEEIKESCLSRGLSVGIINLRGAVVPVFDFGGVAGFREPQKSLTRHSRILILAAKGLKYGILVDQMLQTALYYKADMMDFPELETNGSLKIDKVFADCTFLVKPEAIVNVEDFFEAVEAHDTLFTQGEEKQEVFLKREPYISFNAGVLYGLKLKDVSEIVVYPEELIEPPSSGSACHGLLQLRDKVVPVVELSTIIDTKKDHSKSTKILIIDLGDKKLGVAVSKLGEILSLSENDKTGFSPNNWIVDTYNTGQNGSMFLIDLEHFRSLEV